jgi:1,2-diacylglycerol 3-beta-glucosyltransferase
MLASDTTFQLLAPMREALVMTIASILGPALDVLFVVFGAVLAFYALYLVVLVVAALFHRDRPEAAGRPGEAHSRIVALIPAHDEETLIARTVASLEAQSYPRELFDVVVIADNCTDGTAEAAAVAGARVLVRNEPDLRGKGQALRWAIERILAEPTPPDAVVIVDADSVADPELLARLVERLEGGAEAIQGESLLSNEGSPDAPLRAAAFLLINRARPTGRFVLHLPAALAGNGMLFSRRVLVEHPWSAFTSAEDVEYGLRLRIAGVDPVFARGAIVRSSAAPHSGAAEQQQLRWEGGKLHLARTYVPRLVAAAVRERRPSLLDAALEVSVPPVGFVAAGAGVATVTGAGLVWLDGLAVWALWPALLALVSLPVYVFVGLVAAKAPSWAYLSLARAPLLVGRKALTVSRLLRFRADTWVRTERPSDQ